MRAGGNAAPSPAAAPAAGGPAAPTSAERYWNGFRDNVKNYWSNFFEYHRRGLSQDRTKPWADEDKAPLYTEPSGNWDEHYSVDVQAAIAAQAQRQVGYEMFGGSGGSRKRRKRGDAQAAAEAVRDKLAQQGVAVRLAKMLGFGGNGVASLFEVWPGGEGQPSKKVVVKSLLRRGTSMDAEWSFNVVRTYFNLLSSGQINTLNECGPRPLADE